MILLLDTHAVVWSLLEVSKLSTVAREAIEDEANKVAISVVSAWEIAIKVGLGKWPTAAPLLATFEAHLATAAFDLLAIAVPHVRAAGLIRPRTAIRSIGFSPRRRRSRG